MSDQQQPAQPAISRRKLLASMGTLGAAGAAWAIGGRVPSPVYGQTAGTVTQNVYDPACPPGGGHLTVMHIVTRYGAAGDGATDDTAAFEQALQSIRDAGAGTLYVPAGAYIITRPLRLYKNTTILMDESAVLKKMGDAYSNLKLFVNGQLGNSSYATGYNGEGNITVIGGTIDLCANVNAPSDPSRGFMAFAIGHADGVHIERVTFVNGHNGHIIEFNSSRNVKLINCLFKDQLITTSGMFEMVQIDYASSEAFPSFGSYDDTPCRDVLIEGNTFMNGHRGVGTHGSKFDQQGKQVFHENIRIVNNQFKDLLDVAIRPESYMNSIVSGNTITNAGSHGIPVYSCRNLLISNNVLQGVGFHGIVVTTTADVANEPSDNVTVADNVMADVTNCALRIIGSRNVQIQNNVMSNVKREGVLASTTSQLVVKNNVMRGLSQAADGQYNGIVADGCTQGELAYNRISGDGFTSLYSYAIYVKSTSSGMIVSRNSAESGRAGVVKNEPADTAVSADSSERFLTGTLTLTSGSVALNDNIAKYKQVVVATGGVSTGDLRHEIARGWSQSGFRAGTDYINVATSNGKFVAAIVAGGMELQIISASDPLRYIIGIS